ncbi:hypothetical protein, partial [Pseudodesulfovibrio sp. S3]|uniref:hypothetical protein n=1 Tax=Pseudodesulfovibrio sp. S3 TaxID=2283629 RepID=UPI0019D4C2AE
HPESISFSPPITGRPKSKAAFFWFFFGAAQPKKNPAGRAEKKTWRSDERRLFFRLAARGTRTHPRRRTWNAFGAASAKQCLSRQRRTSQTKSRPLGGLPYLFRPAAQSESQCNVNLPLPFSL